MNTKTKLDPERIISIIDTLEKRIGERFPDSSLRATCKNFLNVAKETKSKIEWISKPNLYLRLFSYLIILLGIGGIVYAISNVEFKVNDTTISNIIALSESVFNDIVLLGAAIFFLVNTESRIKRKRAIEALNDLRVTAHVIDMLQLTKDPNLFNSKLIPTTHSPKRALSKFELERYLD
jgi:uncharacterized protein YjgD (DUF1641 family)